VRGNGESMDTVAVHGGEPRPGPDGSVVFPIYQGTVYETEPGAGYHDLKYIRLNSTPSQQYLHGKLAAIEGAEAAVATSSGMAAVTSHPAQPHACRGSPDRQRVPLRRNP
jgi:Cystathionine beta-lyases/cystathionine gamma-synthases